MDIRIKEDDLGGPEIVELLTAHHAFAAGHSPPESIHALDLDGLRGPEVTVWTAWAGNDLTGCGALKELDPTHGEIKSMHTAAAHRRKGVAASLLAHIIVQARGRFYRRLSLETGSMAAFTPSRTLYARFGFKPCRPYADYSQDPNSAFMTLELATD